ncbi:MAG: glycosyltransferase family 2 protein [Asticcacaulis sp.]
MSDIAVIILTHNEAHHIARALESLRPVAKEVFVIDSGSTDGTAEIAREMGAVVLTNPWVNYAAQFQWGLDNAPVTADWIMRWDADEVMEPELAQNLLKVMPGLEPDVTGLKMHRRHIFMGRFIRHGGRYPLTLLRIWRKGVGRIENRWMDEHIVLSHGRTLVVEGDFSDINLGDLGFFTDKHNKYATREAVDVLNQRYDLFGRDEAFEDQETDQAKRKRGLKENFYNRLPFGVGPIGYFLYRYIFQLGFLDGKEGAIYHGLQGLWYRFLVDAKVLEFDRVLKPLPTREARLETLKALTGLKL